MRKSLLIAFLISLMISGLAFVGSIHFGAAQSGTSFNGIITSDTTWTQAASPYSLTGPVAVDSGATLTIQPGVTVNIYSYIQVNGTLIAIGTSTSQITFNGGYGVQIIFTPVANGWNKQTGSGCIIENAQVLCDVNTNVPLNFNTDFMPDNTLSVDAPSMITNNVFVLNLALQGSSTVTNNIIGQITTESGSPIISNNTIDAELGPTSNTEIAISANAGSVVISNDAIFGTVEINEPSAIISGNTIKPKPYQIAANIIQPAQTELFPGIFLLGNNNCYIYNNFISGGTSGIETDPSFENLIIQNNTITNNSIGIYVDAQNIQNIPTSPIINYNNIQNNSQYSIYWLASLNGNASYNFWGTTDIPTINQTIYDYKNNFNAGTVTFTPILTSPNSEAMPNPNEPIPTPVLTSTSSWSPSPSLLSIKSLPMELIVTGIVVIVIVAVAIIAFLLGRKQGRNSLVISNTA